MNAINAVRSISIGWPVLSYNAMTKWKKFDFLKLGGGCFSKCALPRPGAILECKYEKMGHKRKYTLF